MIKWSEFCDGHVRYEAFLPEHERERCAWLLRASSRGHILREERLDMTWPPRFGPDSGDVAALEALAEKLISVLTSVEVPPGTGHYQPTAEQLPPAEPMAHALHYAVVEEYAQAEASIGLSHEQSAAYLELPVCASGGGLFPVAVTPKRDGRMRRLIALDHLLKNRNDLRSVECKLLRAILADDIQELRDLLRTQGFPLEGDP